MVLIEDLPVNSFLEAVWMRIQDRRDAPAFHYGSPGDRKILTYDQLGSMVIRLTLFLKEFGIKAGDHVAVCSSDRYELPVIDLALQSLQAVSVLMPPDPSPEFYRRTAELFKFRALWIENRELMTGLASEISGVELLSIDRIDEKIPHCRWLEKTTANLEMRMDHLEMITGLAADRPLQKQLIPAPDGNLYVLTLDGPALHQTVGTLYDRAPFKPGNSFISDLPYYELSGRTLSTYLPLTAGASVCYSGGDEILKTAKDLRASVIVLADSSFRNCADVIRQRFEKIPVFLRNLGAGAETAAAGGLRGKLFRRFVTDRLKNSLSDRFYYCVHRLNASDADRYRILEMTGLRFPAYADLPGGGPVYAMGSLGEKVRPDSAGILEKGVSGGDGHKGSVIEDIPWLKDLRKAGTTRRTGWASLAKKLLPADITVSGDSDIGIG